MFKKHFIVLAAIAAVLTFGQCSASAANSVGTLHPCRNWDSSQLTTQSLQKALGQNPKCLVAFRVYFKDPSATADSFTVGAEEKLTTGTLIPNSGVTDSGGLHMYRYSVKAGDRFFWVNHNGISHLVKGPCLNPTPAGVPDVTIIRLPPMPTLVAWGVSTSKSKFNKSSTVRVTCEDGTSVLVDANAFAKAEATARAKGQNAIAVTGTSTGGNVNVTVTCKAKPVKLIVPPTKPAAKPKSVGTNVQLQKCTPNWSSATTVTAKLTLNGKPWKSQTVPNTCANVSAGVVPKGSTIKVTETFESGHWYVDPSTPVTQTLVAKGDAIQFKWRNWRIAPISEYKRTFNGSTETTCTSTPPCGTAESFLFGLKGPNGESKFNVGNDGAWHTHWGFVGYLYTLSEKEGHGYTVSFQIWGTNQEVAAPTVSFTLADSGFAVVFLNRRGVTSLTPAPTSTPSPAPSPAPAITPAPAPKVTAELPSPVTGGGPPPPATGSGPAPAPGVPSNGLSPTGQGDTPQPGGGELPDPQ